MLDTMYSRPHYTSCRRLGQCERTNGDEKTDYQHVTVRTAEVQDVPRIAEIYNQAILRTTATFDIEPKSEEVMRAWLAHHDARHPVLVASVDTGGSAVGREQVIGWSSLSRWSERSAYDGTVEISLYVDEAYRGRGVGTRLFARAVEFARDEQYHVIVSRIAGDNDVSLRLHDRFGFSFIGTMREVGLKFGRLLDVHLYQLLL